jgi:hypothetical protein
MSEETKKLTFKDYAQLISVVILVASIFWKGGQLTQQLESIAIALNKIDTRQEIAAIQQAQDRADLRVLQEKFLSLDARVNRLERNGSGRDGRDGRDGGVAK